MNFRKYLASGIALTMLAGTVAIAGCSKTTDSGTSGTSGQSTGGTTSELSGTVNIQGSDTLLNLSTAWSEAFMKENPNVDITVQGGGSGTGIAALINGTVDFANASREMTPEEIAKAKANGHDPIEHKVALDGIAVVVNSSNAVTGLTKDQLGKIFRGEITNWKDVGGADQPIVLLSRDSSSGTYEFFKEAIVGKDKNYAQSAKLLPSNQAIADEVKSNAGGIGYIGLGYVTSAVKVVAVDGVKASVQTAKDKSYPISRYLYMYGAGQSTGAAKAFLDWVTGPEGQKLVADEGFVPLQ